MNLFNGEDTVSPTSTNQPMTSKAYIDSGVKLQTLTASVPTQMSGRRFHCSPPA
jgi:hypothetical protein